MLIPIMTATVSLRTEITEDETLKKWAYSSYANRGVKDVGCHEAAWVLYKVHLFLEVVWKSRWKKSI